MEEETAEYALKMRHGFEPFIFVSKRYDPNEGEVKITEYYCFNCKSRVFRFLPSSHVNFCSKCGARIIWKGCE